MRYQGVSGVGHGAMYIGKGTMVGVDVTGARYHGTYTDQGGALSGNVTLTSASSTLVTGQPVPAGTKVPITFQFSGNFANRHFKTVNVAGKPVQVAFDKIGDIP